MGMADQRRWYGIWECAPQPGLDADGFARALAARLVVAGRRTLDFTDAADRAGLYAAYCAFDDIVRDAAHRLSGTVPRYRRLVRARNACAPGLNGDFAFLAALMENLRLVGRDRSLTNTAFDLGLSAALSFMRAINGADRDVLEKVFSAFQRGCAEQSREASLRSTDHETTAPASAVLNG